MRILTLLFLSASLFACSSKEDTVYPDPSPYTLDVPAYFSEKYSIPEDNPTTIEGVELGRMLFYEKALSRDQSVSCGSCHQQQYAFSDPRVKSVGVEGRLSQNTSMSLSNLLWFKRFMWNGKATSLEEQVLFPIENPLEMDLSIPEAVARIQAIPAYEELFKRAFPPSGEINASNLAKAIAQFERTLLSSNSRYDKYIRNELELTASELNGKKLFFSHPIPDAEIRGANCGDCHAGNLMAGNSYEFYGFFNNGLDPEDLLKDGLFEITSNLMDKGKFKAVSLRNIAITAPYMHDGRFATLEEVLDHYNEHIQMSSTLSPLIIAGTNIVDLPDGEIYLGLTAEEKADVIAFLKTLTDSSFISDPKFADPHH